MELRPWPKVNPRFVLRNERRFLVLIEIHTVDRCLMMSDQRPHNGDRIGHDFGVEVDNVHDKTMFDEGSCECQRRRIVPTCSGGVLAVRREVDEN